MIATSCQDKSGIDNGVRPRPFSRIKTALKKSTALGVFWGGVAWPTLTVAPAHAMAPFFSDTFFQSARTGEVLAFSAFLATLGFSVVSTFLFMRARRAIAEERDALAQQLSDLRARSERFETLIEADDQRLVVWTHKSERPTITGSLPDTCSAPEGETDFMAFGKWLTPASAAGLERHISDLRANGSSFQLAITTQMGQYLDAYGRTAGGRVFVRFRDLSGDQQVIMELRRKLGEKSADASILQSLLEEIDQPVWMRRTTNEPEAPSKLSWGNRAFRDAVEAGSEPDQLADLLDQDALAAIDQCHANGDAFRKTMNAVSQGERRAFSIVSVPTDGGSAAMATDVSDAQRAQADLKRTIESHEKTLNELPTAVAIFDRKRRMTFHNKAYRELFGLSESYLASAPTDSEIIDKLRNLEKIPVEANFREWKKALLKAQQSVEMEPLFWHLPDGQTLRVIASPHSTGGTTWIYENLTDQINLESRVNTFQRLQGETLNRLSDGVAVFSSDGLLTLSNTSFGDLWNIDEEMRGGSLSIKDIAAACVETQGCEAEWHDLKMAVVGISDKRAEAQGQMYRPDGSVLSYSTNALIDGRTMVTFVDITDSINFERAMTEKNEALKEADNLKDEFVQHMSYELRTPLTNIIGFAQLLSDMDMGPLTAKQAEYIDYILSSSSSVLAIINDILDLATADAGVLELNLAHVNVNEAITSAIEGLRDRLRDREIEFVCDVTRDVETFHGDERRIVQILFKLLSNAIQFSHNGGKVALSVSTSENHIVFQVQDWGVGMPEAFIEQAFKRFESRNSGKARGGVGLGLPMVKRFVELHEGSVDIESVEGRGTKVVFALPLKQAEARDAAE